MKVTNNLFELRDTKYAIFHSKLIPNIDKNKVIGVRVPVIRALASEYIKDAECVSFINDLPHKYYDENILHSIIISKINNYEECINEVNKFLPYIDNWAVSDILNPKVFKSNKDKLIKEINKWVNSVDTYTCRFGIYMLMIHFLDEDFKEEYLVLPSRIHTSEYYINMMISWFYATSLAKNWDYTIGYLENNKLDKWVHNKTIQKSIESFRITDKQKEYLKGLRR